MLRFKGSLELGIGAGLGLLSFASDYVLRYPLSAIGNLAGPWVLAAFAVGALRSAGATVRGAASGLLTLLTATLVYYVSSSFMWPASEVGRLIPGALVWGLVAALAGPAAGAAGTAWRNGTFVGRSYWWLRPTAVAGVAAVLLAEAVFFGVLISDPDPLAVGAELIVAGTIPLALLRSRRDWLTAYVALGLLALVCVPVMAVVLPRLFSLAGAGW